jgi:DMATS type aromatic prenyltransferase
VWSTGEIAKCSPDSAGMEATKPVSSGSDKFWSTLWTPEDSPAAFWWKTAGLDIAKMLYLADYPESIQVSFLAYFRSSIFSVLGEPPNKGCSRSGLSWDGTPFKYSLEFGASAKKPKVRLGVDVTELRAVSVIDPLNMASTMRVVQEFAMPLRGLIVPGTIACTNDPAYPWGAQMMPV